MNQLEQIEKIYQKWDGTPEDATICMKYIYLVTKGHPQVNDFLNKNKLNI